MIPEEANKLMFNDIFSFFLNSDTNNNETISFLLVAEYIIMDYEKTFYLCHFKKHLKLDRRKEELFSIDD